MAVILITAIPAALLYAFFLAKKLSPRTNMIVAYVWWIVLIIVFPLVVSNKSDTSFYLAIFLSIFVGAGFGLFYAIEMANYLMVVPKNEVSEYVFGY